MSFESTIIEALIRNEPYSMNEAIDKVIAAHEHEVAEARIDELKRNAYYSQPRKTDPLTLCGIDMNAEQVNARLKEITL